MMNYNIQVQSECDVTTFQVPPSAGATVTVDGHQLVPSPFVNIDIQKFTTNDIVTGGIWKIQLNGTVVGASFTEVSGEIKTILNLAKNSDCVDIVISCAEAFIDGKGKIISVSADEGSQPSWVNRASYSIEIDLYTNEGQVVVPPSSGNGLCTGIENLALQDISEQFTLSIDEDSFNWGTVPGSQMENTGVGNRHVKLSFSVSARGIGGNCGEDGDVKFGLEAVEEYMVCRLEKLKDMDISGIENEPPKIKAALDAYRGPSYLDFRSIEVDPFTSTMTINGDIIYRPSGCYEDVYTSVTVEESMDTEGTDITISGSITGLVDIDYTDLIKAGKYLDDANSCTFNEKMNNAKTFFDEFKDPDNIKAIALAHLASPTYITDPCTTANGEESIPCFTASAEPSPESCDIRITASQVSRDYAAGQINFSFTLSTKANTCAFPGISNLEIEATHDIPRDSIVEIIVPGRGAKGALIQNLCCLTAEKWSFTVNLTLAKNGCKIAPEKPVTELNDCSHQIINKFIEDSGITPNPKENCWFVTDNQESVGRNTYRLTVQYTKPSCP
jgi:hypothetical protein